MLCNKYQQLRSRTSDNHTRLDEQPHQVSQSIGRNGNLNPVFRQLRYADQTPFRYGSCPSKAIPCFFCKYRISALNSGIADQNKQHPAP
ncbi:hypothetical protein, partial [Arcticibacter sp.]|uniref:hypothetical protein n=1 Tax=Arcticibacter sp. TaxID=1872630 RepID=UPI0038910B1F